MASVDDLRGLKHLQISASATAFYGDLDGGDVVNQVTKQGIKAFSVNSGSVVTVVDPFGNVLIDMTVVPGVQYSGTYSQITAHDGGTINVWF
jgi:hypothetical protein